MQNLKCINMWSRMRQARNSKWSQEFEHYNSQTVAVLVHKFRIIAWLKNKNDWNLSNQVIWAGKPRVRRFEIRRAAVAHHITCLPVRNLSLNLLIKCHFHKIAVICKRALPLSLAFDNEITKTNRSFFWKSVCTKGCPLT